MNKFNNLNQQMIDSMVPVFYEYFLTVGEDGVIEHIIESGVDLCLCPKVKEKIKNKQLAN